MVVFHKGDQVLFRTHHLSDAAAGISKKLQPKWEGPCVISKVLSLVTFALQGHKITFHVNDLKQYHDAQRASSLTSNAIAVPQVQHPGRPQRPRVLPAKLIAFVQCLPSSMHHGQHAKSFRQRSLGFADSGFPRRRPSNHSSVPDEDPGVDPRTPLVTPLHPTPPSFNVPVQEAVPVSLMSALTKLPLDPVPEPERMDMDIESPPPIILSDPSSPVPVDGPVVSAKLPAKDASYKLQPLEMIFQTLERPPPRKMAPSLTATSPAMVAAVSLARSTGKSLAPCPSTSQVSTSFPPRRVAPSAKESIPKRVPTRPAKMKAPTSRRERWRMMMSLCKAAQQAKDPEVPVVLVTVPSEETPTEEPPKDVPQKESSKGTKRSKVPKTKEPKEKKKKRADRVKK